ncbi:MAG TPA: O-antigen ligase family protein [Candidatus Dormibacteraeota bacterium]
MQRHLDRLSGYFPAALAGALPIVFIPNESDNYILPRASLVIGGACLGIGLALVAPSDSRLGSLRWPLLAATAAAFLAFALSVSWPLSLAGSYTRYESLPVRLSYLGLFAAAAWLARERTHRDWVVAAFVFGTCVASLEGVQQWNANVGFRPDGNLGNANLLAALVAMAVPLAVGRALRGGSFVLAWGAAIPVLAAGLLVTTSRSGGFGVLAGCLTLAVFASRGRLVMGTALASIAIVGAGLFVLLASPLRALNNDPPELRLHLWGDGLRMIAARPLTGWGEDTTGLSFGHFLSQDYASLVSFDRVHSGPLDIAATQGILGLAALAWVLVVLFRGAWRQRFDREAAALSAALVGYTVWVAFNFDWAPVTGPFWLLAGTLWAAVSPPRLPGRAGVGSRVAQPALAAALVLAATVLAVFPVLADMWYVKGRADLSVRVDPLQAQYHWAIGTVAEMRRAAELGEPEPDMYVQLGDREAQLGNRAQARRDYQRALEIDPYFSPAAEHIAALGP